MGCVAVLETNLSEGIAYYCGFSHSSVALLPDAEERPQRLDTEGNLLVGDAVAGAEREAQYAEFDRRARKAVAAEPAGLLRGPPTAGGGAAPPWSRSPPS
ncbi:hypothetical protein STENM223S_01849 [Streptomyces tendae]